MKREINRLGLVEDLLKISKPLHKIVAQLATLSWDYEGDCVTLKRTHVFSVLERYRLNQLSAQEVEYWANQIESREDIVFEEAWEQEIGDVIYQLANPELTRHLNQEQSKLMLAELRKDDRLRLVL
ncbi:MAG: hypothetical protein ACI802_002535 [Candidatus Paceibacteria bacterium]|jgi:hypothetical protein